MREIVLDTETTGLEVNGGHRIIEIGCIELFNSLPTGKTYHSYINPGRQVSESAFKVHGLSSDFLKNHPPFRDCAQSFLDFIQNDPLIIHNAPFDMRFLNKELSTLGLSTLSWQRVKDTLTIARRKFPGSPASLDALCRRFKIDNSTRDKHGALLDAELLAGVYLELIGGRQPALSFEKAEPSLQKPLDGESMKAPLLIQKVRQKRPTLEPSPQEKATHQSMLKKIKNPIWQRLFSAP